MGRNQLVHTPHQLLIRGVGLININHTQLHSSIPSSRMIHASNLSLSTSSPQCSHVRGFQNPPNKRGKGSTLSRYGTTMKARRPSQSPTWPLDFAFLLGESHPRNLPSNLQFLGCPAVGFMPKGVGFPPKTNGFFPQKIGALGRCFSFSFEGVLVRVPSR